MSRHRLVRNLDYNGQPEAHLEAYLPVLNESHHTGPSAELEEYDGFSDSQEEEMTEEQHGTLSRSYLSPSPA